MGTKRHPKSHVKVVKAIPREAGKRLMLWLAASLTIAGKAEGAPGLVRAVKKVSACLPEEKKSLNDTYPRVVKVSQGKFFPTNPHVL